MAREELWLCTGENIIAVRTVTVELFSWSSSRESLICFYTPSQDRLHSLETPQHKELNSVCLCWH